MRQQITEAKQNYRSRWQVKLRRKGLPMKLCGICLCITSVVFCFGLVNNQAESSDGTKQKISWKTILSYNDWLDQDPVVMRIPEGYLIAGISHRKIDKENYEYKVVLWKIDLQGKELWVKDVNLPAWQTDKSFIPSRSFSLQDEPTLLIIESLGPKPRRAWLLRFDDAGSVVFSKEFSSQQVFDVQGLRKTTGGFLLYGSDYKGGQNSDARVTKLDQDGNEVWRREYDKGKMEWGTGLAPQEDGGFILGANSGIYNKFGAGPSEVWIIKCDRDGNILKETTFEGRHPTVIGNGDITAVVFNKENFPQQDMAVVGLNGELETLWRIDSLFGKTGGLGMLTTIVDKQGNFVLAGNKFLAARIWKVGKDGDILGEIEIEGAEYCVQFELLQTPTGYLVAGHAPTMSKTPLTADGKVAKGKKWDSMDILVAEVADLAK
jgi:hypothetical protein